MDTTKLKPIDVVEIEQQKEYNLHSVDHQQVFVSFNCNPLSWGTDEMVTILHFVPTAGDVAYDPQQALRDIDQLQFSNEECEHKFDQYGVYRCTFRIEYVKSRDYFSSGDDVDELYHFEDGELMFAFNVDSGKKEINSVELENSITWEQKAKMIMLLQQYKQSRTKQDLEVFELFTLDLLEKFDVQAWEMLVEELHIDIIESECSRDFAKRFATFAKISKYPIGNGSWRSSIEGLLPIVLQLKLQLMLISIK